MNLENYNPVSEAVVDIHKIPKAKYPVIDFHTHMGKLLLGDHYEDVYDTGAYVHQLNELGVVKCVNLDGFYGDDLIRMNQKIEGYQDVFITFMWIDFSNIQHPDFEEMTRKQILDSYNKGARGIKLWKDISLYKKIRTDDVRLNVIYETAAELNIPVLMHVGDPKAFFKEKNEKNERYEELNENPDWDFSNHDEFMSFEELLAMQENTIRLHPKTRFVIAHVGSCAEDLKWVSDQLHKYPNMNVDLAARIAELGRVPYSARKFFYENQDQIVFGTDGSPASLEYHAITYRFLETMDEYFPYQPEGEIPGQGRWAIYGIGLEDEILKKIYYKNACRLLNIQPEDIYKE